MKGTPRRGAGRQDVVDRLTRRYRLWALLPPDVQALAALGPPGGPGALIAIVPRPPFPPGVCVDCGCTEDDPCLDGGGEPCSWLDRARRHCSNCDAGGVLARLAGSAGILRQIRTARGKPDRPARPRPRRR